MRQIKACTKKLIRAILESEEYVQYEELREKVKEEPELRQQINNFRFHVYEVQNSKEPLDMYEEQKKLCRESEEFRKKPLVDEYLKAELRLCRMMQKITEEVAEALDLDTEEIAGRIDL